MSGEPVLLGSLHSHEGEGVVRVKSRFDNGIDDLWEALTRSSRLACWYGQVEADISEGSEFHVRIDLAGERTGRVDVWEPPHRLVLTMRDPDPQPGQPGETVIETRLCADAAHTLLVWEERGIPVALLAAYGTGIQIHIEHLADYISGRELRDAEARWSELFPAYEAQGVS